MAGFLGFALAGAAESIGTGMVERAREQRAFALDYARNQWAMEREDRQFGRQMQLQDRQFERQDMRDERQWERLQQRDKMSGGDVVRLEGGRDVVRRGNQVFDLTDAEGNPVNLDRASGSGDRTFEFERKFEMASRFYDEQTAFEIATGSRSASPREVRDMARKEAEMMMPTDALGNITMSAEERKALIDKTYDELMDLFGTRGRAGASRGAGRSQSPRMPGMEAPPGEGSQRNPYQATTPDHVEWFKENAPAGAVIVIEGERYTKD